MLDTAFDALKKFDWGSDLKALAPIDEAANAGHGKPDAMRDLENRLIDALKGDLTRDAQDYICRKLSTVGSAAAVPTLAVLLVKKENSHMSRFALERIPGPEAGQALRDGLGKISGDLKIGVISSLGGRRDAEAVDALGGLMKDADPAIARAATLALGAIGTAKSAEILQSNIRSSTETPPAAVDALLQCAEALLAGNKQADAQSIYKLFAQENQPRLVRLAGVRGLLACASKQA